MAVKNLRGTLNQETREAVDHREEQAQEGASIFMFVELDRLESDLLENPNPSKELIEERDELIKRAYTFKAHDEILEKVQSIYLSQTVAKTFSNGFLNKILVKEFFIRGIQEFTLKDLLEIMNKDLNKIPYQVTPDGGRTWVDDYIIEDNKKVLNTQAKNLMKWLTKATSYHMSHTSKEIGMEDLKRLISKGYTIAKERWAEKLERESRELKKVEKMFQHELELEVLDELSIG